MVDTDFDVPEEEEENNDESMLEEETKRSKKKHGPLYLPPKRVSNL